MKTLDEKKWSPVQIGDTFILQRGRESKFTISEGGKTPFVSAKKADNGYRMFVNGEQSILPSNSLSLNNNGDGGAGFGFYQPDRKSVV